METIKKPDITLQYPNQYEKNQAIEQLINYYRKNTDKDYTEQEIEFVAQYTGMGGQVKHGAEGKGIMTEYYTSDVIVQKMWALAYKYGFKDNSKILEPSVGTGKFLKYVPADCKIDGYEINLYALTVCKLLYPDANIKNKYFEQHFIENNKSVKNNVNAQYDLVIGNPPYGTFNSFYAGMGEKSYTKAQNLVDYFILRGLDVLKPGGLLIYIVGASLESGGNPFLATANNKAKEQITQKGELIDAYRLSNNMFEFTDVLSDIIIIRKK